MCCRAAAAPRRAVPRSLPLTPATLMQPIPLIFFCSITDNNSSSHAGAILAWGAQFFVYDSVIENVSKPY